MTLFKEYLQPRDVDQALEQLTAAEGTTAVVAGGTDLLLDIRQARHPNVDVMVDVSAVKEMREISLQGDYVNIGAAATHKEIISNPILLEHARCVVEGCGLIGGPQVRNVATIGGNVAHALPAGDGTVALLALGTEIELASQEGRRWEPLLDIFEGPGRVNFDRKENLVVGFRFLQKGKGEASAFHRVMRPQGVAIAILNMASWVKMSQETLIDVKLSCGPAGPRPFRAFRTEELIKGKRLDGELFKEACNMLSQEVSLRTSAHRATKEYRHMLLPVLLQRVLEKAISRSIDKPFNIEGVNND